MTRKILFCSQFK